MQILWLGTRSWPMNAVGCQIESVMFYWGILTVNYISWGVDRKTKPWLRFERLNTAFVIRTCQSYTGESLMVTIWALNPARSVGPQLFDKVCLQWKSNKKYLISSIIFVLVPSNPATLFLVTFIYLSFHVKISCLLFQAVHPISSYPVFI